MNRIRPIPVVAGITAVMVVRFLVIVIVVAAVVFVVLTMRGQFDRSSTPSKPGTPNIRPTIEHHARFKNCNEAKAAGRSNIPKGDRDYRPSLDKDNDGIACEVGKD
jgi:hypothetical protein